MEEQEQGADMQGWKLTLAAAGLMAACGSAAAQEPVTYEEVHKACMTGMELPEGVCDCMADDILSDEFNDTQRRWMVLAATDPDAAEAVTPEMQPMEAMQISMTMATGPGKCAAGG